MIISYCGLMITPSLLYGNQGIFVRHKLGLFLRYNGMMPWIYLSPHFDDVALSCGGLVWEQAQQGELVSIWTICAGEALFEELSPFARGLHQRWELGQNAPAERRMEDFRSSQRLGASSRYFSITDCIYRRDPGTGEFMYASEAALNGALQAGDSQVIHKLEEEIQRSLEPHSDLVCPLGFGKHVDHQLTRRATEGLEQDFWYYADYPYVLQNGTLLEQMEADGWISHAFPITPDGLTAWMDSISAHASQISTFWVNDLAMRQAVTEYLHSNGGIRLWKKPRA
jgi:LmbE family N-acetylglucosaminyl deacetylase